MAAVHGIFRVAGLLRIFVNADYATSFSPNVEQEFSVRVLFDSGETGGWAFERTLHTQKRQPAYEDIGHLDFLLWAFGHVEIPNI